MVRNSNSLVPAQLGGPIRPERAEIIRRGDFPVGAFTEDILWLSAGDVGIAGQSAHLRLRSLSGPSRIVVTFFGPSNLPRAGAGLGVSHRVV